MKKNDLIKTENGIFRILSIEADRVLAIDCIKKTMPKFYPISSFGNGEFVDCLDADFTDMEDLSPTHRKVAQERYTMIASAVSVVDDIPKRNLMIEKSAEQFGMSKQSIACQTSSDQAIINSVHVYLIIILHRIRKKGEACA